MKTILNEKDVQKRISLLTMLLNGVMIKGPTINEVSGLLKASLDMDDTLTKEKLKITNNDVKCGLNVIINGAHIEPVFEILFAVVPDWALFNTYG